MQKTKLGITVGLLGATIYFIGLFDNNLIPFLLTGYVLLFENNEWLKRNAVKAFALLVSFAVLEAIVYIVPDFMNFIESIFGIFSERFDIYVISNITTAISSIIRIVKHLFLIAFGLKSLNQGNVSFPLVDNLIKKHM